ncbi:OmpA family protein [Methylovulum psychrotolerans]|uniref:OmpA/MotB family protein n=1 Tax=Methylovulum psychrotolerans TaxID=1704499 RepID=UPI001BFF066E|nr:OmpA family protein [Methylovulum psychrotolerans]MBT9096284.1 OmpA family protein [Methylovulum psychrotolerans]
MKHQHTEDEGEHWLSVSDMMSGLMVIFLFIAITYMMQISEDRNQLVEIAVTYEKTKSAIYEQLLVEFKDDLKKWNAEIDKQSLAFRFQEPDVLFNVGEAEIKDKFKVILDEFFPRYIKILKQYQADIEEIRIEGHTSSEWSTKFLSPEKSYFLNMELSQNRTRATLEYCLMLPQIASERAWIKQILTANGLSSSKPILVNGQEDTVHSRRVEFKVKTNSETQILKILQRK